MNSKGLRRGISAGAIVVALVHLLWPSVKVDAITVTLIVIAVLPWLSPLLKSLELPGGLKVEFQDLKNVSDRAEKAGLLAADTGTPIVHEYPFQLAAETDPNLALAGLRIEIEKRLIQIAESSGVKVTHKGMGSLLRELSVRELIGNNERSILADLTSLLNAAVHGASVDRMAANWALDTGPRILHALDDRIASSVIKDGGNA